MTPYLACRHSRCLLTKCGRLGRSVAGTTLLFQRVEEVSSWEREVRSAPSRGCFPFPGGQACRGVVSVSHHHTVCRPHVSLCPCPPQPPPLIRRQDAETSRGESEKRRNLSELSQAASEDSDVFGEADASPNNGASSGDTAVTDSKRTADPKNAWQDARPADPGSRPHLVRLFSRDAPGREDNTFKDRPSESDELQTIQEDSAAAPEGLDVMASQKRPSQRHGSKYLATASTADHARHGFLPRRRDTGILDSIGRFFSSDRAAPKRGSGKVSSEE
nr:myelin basic protein-like [Microcebus murinus]